MDKTPIKIFTPFGKHSIELKPWITGAEAEYINEPLFSAISMSPNVENKTADLGKIDLGKVSQINHRLIEKFVISVDGITDNILDVVLGMHEEDTDFIYEKINELRKKK